MVAKVELVDAVVNVQFIPLFVGDENPSWQLQAYVAVVFSDPVQYVFTPH